jgi:hypothetical protein
MRPNELELRGHIRRAMIHTNPDLISIADGVRDSRESCGHWIYAAAHLRLGDGIFADAEARRRNVRLV